MKGGSAGCGDGIFAINCDMQSVQRPSEEHINELPSTHLTCPVCGMAMYPTDRNNFEITYRCSSADARFWDYDRGTEAQKVAKDHWDRSLQEVFLNRG